MDQGECNVLTQDYSDAEDYDEHALTPQRHHLRPGQAMSVTPPNRRTGIAAFYEGSL